MIGVRLVAACVLAITTFPMHVSAQEDADRSLSIEVYVEGGMPAPDRVWFANDYYTASGALARFLQRAPETLPRVGSKKSGAMFDRLVAIDNLDAAANASFRIDQRLAYATGLLAPLSQIMHTYHDAARKDASFVAELAELIGFTLRASAVTMPLTRQYLATLSPDDPTLATRLDGLTKMRAGLAAIVAGTVEFLESSQLTSLQRVRLAGALRETLPFFRGDLPPASLRELARRLRTLSGRETDSRLKAELDRLAEAVSPTPEAGESRP